ncbi:hypothetical protein SDC9_128124 [bioreactor metagenome]|uniref:Uncharacterized protein n=1 Tax=bioreactor metagenome TaxID=1076179 RepID=A0A645CWJ8_9ZZZZ
MLVHQFHVGRAAACGHVPLPFRFALTQLMGFMEAGCLSALGDFHNRREPSRKKRLLDLGKGSGELPFDGRGYEGGHVLLCLEHLDHRHDTRSLNDGTKGAAHGTTTTADALLIVDLDIAFLVLLHRIDRTSLLTRYRNMHHGMERADFLALAAADAASIIDVSLAIGEGDAVFRAVCQAGPGETTATSLADQVTVWRTG